MNRSYRPSIEALESLNLLSGVNAVLPIHALQTWLATERAVSHASLAWASHHRAAFHAPIPYGTPLAHTVWSSLVAHHVAAITGAFRVMPTAPVTGTSHARITTTATVSPGGIHALGATTKPLVSTKSYDYYIDGNTTNVSVATAPGLMLQGGGSKIPDAINWMNDKAHGGDWVVLEASGDSADADAIYNICHPNSVSTIVTKTRDAAFDPFVIQTIQHAEGIFLAGGDQSDYVNLWKGTPLADALNQRTQVAPLGGNSAGLAVIGQFVFTADKNTISSKEALANPFSSHLTLGRDFLTLPYMENVITDSHLVERDRMGRLVAFMGRLASDGWTTGAKGIGVDRETAVLVEPTTGIASVVGTGTYDSAAFFLEPTTTSVLVCQPKTALTYTNISVVRVTPGETFNLNTWTSPDGEPYSLSATAGVLTSSAVTGGIYG